MIGKSCKNMFVLFFARLYKFEWFQKVLKGFQVGLVFFLCSYVCLVADPSSMSSFMGLLWDGLSHKARGNHVR